MDDVSSVTPLKLGSRLTMAVLAYAALDPI